MYEFLRFYDNKIIEIYKDDLSSLNEFRSFFYIEMRSVF